MKTCPQCQSVYPDDYVFCLGDGTMLKEIETEQETVVRSKVNLGETAALSPEMLVICPSCQLSNRSNSKFCKKCGNDLSGQNSVSGAKPVIGFPEFKPNLPDAAPVGAAGFKVNLSEKESPAQSETMVLKTPSFVPPGQNGENSALRAGKSNQKVIFIAAVVLVAALVGVVVWIANQPHPAEAKLNRVIKNNQLIKPAGDNAMEYYRKMKTDGVDEKILGKYEDEIFPKLIEQTESLFASVKDIGSASKSLNEWQEAAAMLEWASEIRGSDSAAAAKAEFAKGRANYLTDQKPAAIENWKKAADLDKNWALPLNGIGLIYNEQKNYNEARKWLEEAIRREPNWVVPYNNLGTSYFFQDRFDEAEQYYLKAVEIEPRWARPHAWLASIAMKRYDCSRAVAEFEKVLAPDAISASEMNLTSIRRQMEKAKNCAYYYESPVYW